ncbi:MAG: response regulator transcription factor [Schwartzia sp.]|nr:response regulator transcription factor [Schwartzia sp. (in: firmicutes)]
MVQLLIADDNAAIVDILSTFAQNAGYQVTAVADGEAALKAFHAGNFDVVLLDVMMPKLDGFEVCRAIRAESLTPVLMITARGEDYDRIMGLDIGADDYIVKPFSPAEVMARVRAVLRRLERPSGSAAPVIVRDNLTLSPDSCRASVGGQEIPLTKKEFDILCLLAENRGRVFSRDHLLERLWGFDYEGDTRTVDTHIKRLRAKLAAVPHPGWQIKTAWGVGYSFEVTP